MCMALGLSGSKSSLLNDLRSYSIQVCIINESKPSDSHTFSPLLEGYEKFISPGRRCGGAAQEGLKFADLLSLSGSGGQVGHHRCNIQR